MKVKLILMAMLVSVTALAQKMPSDYFEEANQYYDAGQIGKALKGYQYFVKHFPKDKSYPRALYNVAECQFQILKYGPCVKTCLKLMAVEADEQEPLGGGIMDDPYANYRHRAADMISECYRLQEQWDSALHYLALADTVYPLIHFCGNAYAQQNVMYALRYAQIYEGLGQPDKGIEKLLQTVFLDYLANNRDVLEELQRRLSGREGLLEELDAALDAMYEKSFEYVDSKGETQTYTRYYISFLNVEIEVPEYYISRGFISKSHEPDVVKEDDISNIKQTSFYKMIAEL